MLDTDKDKLVELFKKFNISIDNSGNDFVEIGPGDGYVGFWARFSFDKDGKFLSHGIYE